MHSQNVILVNPRGRTLHVHNYSYRTSNDKDTYPPGDQSKVAIQPNLGRTRDRGVSTNRLNLLLNKDSLDSSALIIAPRISEIWTIPKPLKTIIISISLRSWLHKEWAGSRSRLFEK